MSNDTGCAAKKVSLWSGFSLTLSILKTKAKSFALERENSFDKIQAFFQALSKPLFLLFGQVDQMLCLKEYYKIYCLKFSKKTRQGFSWIKYFSSELCSSILLEVVLITRNSSDVLSSA